MSERSVERGGEHPLDWCILPLQGMSLPEDADLLWIADEALNEGEQPDWEECLDIKVRLCYLIRFRVRVRLGLGVGVNPFTRPLTLTLSRYIVS